MNWHDKRQARVLLRYLGLSEKGAINLARDGRRVPAEAFQLLLNIALRARRK